jgi:hypothetical protein
MSRGHKILQTFLQKRGAWDNNPYKEPEMKKPEPPFEPDKNPKKFAVAGKAGYGPSAARHLARKGLEQMLKLNPKLKETWSDGVLDQLSEVHPAVMAMARVGANKALKAKADQHTELAVAANRAGDDEKVRYHQAQVAKIKAQMQTAQAEGYIDYTRPSGAAYDATMVKGKMVITKNKPYEPYGAAPAKKKVTKLPMTQAAGALAAEAVTYTGMGTDVVDKKKKLNPQPNLTMKPKQVKDYMEGKVYDPITKKMVATKPIKVQAGGGATRNGVPVETGPSKYKTISQAYHAATAGQTVTPKQKLKNEEVELDEGKMKDIYTSMMHHADKKGYSSHKQFKKADYDAVGKEHGISGGDVAIVAGHHTADSYNKLKEENLDELKASTLQSYADKAHQQAQDATYDAAHLNRSGEEKFKAAAKRLASKRAGGVQLAQTKMDRKYNAAGDAYRAHTGINSNKQLYNKEALELPHSMGDTVRCTRTQRLATVAGFDNDKYTVVYGDGSTETGAADYWTTVHKVNHGDSHGGA